MKAQELVNSALLPVISWIGKQIFSLPGEITVLPNGSGDTTFNYLQLFLYAMLAIVTAIVWSLIDFKRASYRNLQDFAFILIRYYLAVVMASYGAYKVVQLQFPEPYLARLLQPFGEFSPMGLAWTFLGYSYPYTFFGGLAEVVGALLLMFRRTVLAGTLVLIPVLANVVMINFSYDVPVKLYSSHLLLFCFALLAPFARQLVNVVILNRPTERVELPFRVWPQTLLWPRVAFKLVFIVGFLCATGLTVLESRNSYGAQVPPPPMYGIYEIQEFRLNGIIRPPLLTDLVRWRYLVIDKQFGCIVPMQGAKQWLTHETDTVAQALTLTLNSDSTAVYRLTYSADSGEYLFNGVVRGDTIEMSAKQLLKRDFQIFKTGFNWVNEYPNNQ
jgi:hypothetical protein